MSDRPILFSAPMVRAILREIEQPGTGKTQTRRIMNPQPPASARYSGIHFASDEPASHFFNSSGRPFKVRQRIEEGDRLYVREAWCSDTRNDSVKPSEIATTEPVWFSADGTGINLTDWSLKSSKNRPGMFLPRWASRLTLTVTNVRVQKLQEIDEVDACAEGVQDGYGDPYHEWAALSYRRRFHLLWDHINAARAYGWDTNPWIVAVTFTVEKSNIDQAAG